MAELDEDEVAGSEGGGDGVELAFDRIGAGGTAGYGGVDDGDLERVVEPFAPAWASVGWGRQWRRGKKEVLFVPLPLPPGVMVESPAR